MSTPNFDFIQPKISLNSGHQITSKYNYRKEQDELIVRIGLHEPGSVNLDKPVKQEKMVIRDFITLDKKDLEKLQIRYKTIVKEIGHPWS